MTIDAVLTHARLQEVRALERVRLAIVSNASDPDWLYCVAALDERLYQLRELLRREDLELIRTCERQLESERSFGADMITNQVRKDHGFDSELPRGARVH